VKAFLCKGIVERIDVIFAISTPNPKVEIAKMVLSLALSVFAKNISPTHRFGGYFL